jgi:hypothetical protein
MKENKNNLIKLGNKDLSRRNFFKFFGLTTATATGIALKDFFSPKPAKCASGRCDCVKFNGEIGIWEKEAVTGKGICKPGCSL